MLNEQWEQKFVKSTTRTYVTSGTACCRNDNPRCHQRWQSRQIDDLLQSVRRGIAMMTSSNGNIFRVTGHLCREFAGHRCIPHTKVSDAELSLICAWINEWWNNRDAGDLRRYRAHYDVTVMVKIIRQRGHTGIINKRSFEGCWNHNKIECEYYVNSLRQCGAYMRQ